MIKSKPITLFMIALFILVSSCSPQKTNTSHQMYIWQHVWTSELIESIQSWQPKLFGVRVLTAYYSANLKFKVIEIDWSVLSDSAEITQVFRINGVKLPKVLDAAELINKQISMALDHGRTIDAIEIDFDAPTSKLPDYESWLSELKGNLTFDVKLSITTLPTWFNSKHLAELLRKVDQYVLQVHSVESPEKSLVDFAGAEKSIISFSNTYNKPFLVSLPNYWYQAATDKNNKIKAILAEGQSIESTQSKQIFAEPNQLHKLMLQIENLKLNNFKGWVWFRMPTSKDQQVFSNDTMKKLFHDKSIWNLKPIELNLVPIESIHNSTNYDVFIENTETVEQTIQSKIEVPKNCQIKHLISDFKAQNNQLIEINQRLYRPKQSIRIGWASCDQSE